MAFIFVTSDGVTLMDGRRGPLVYQDRRDAERILPRLEEMYGKSIRIEEYQPRFGEMRYGGEDRSRKRRRRGRRRRRR